MELKTESMKNMKKVVEKCLDDLMKKPDLTPAETKAALDGFKLYDELCCRIEDCNMEEEYSERGYSGYEIPYRQYQITSYGMPERAFANRHRGRMSRMDGSYDWYQSNHEYPMYRGMRSYTGDGYSERRGYSRHSLSDRVVSMLEKMMDSVESGYEQQELHKYIRAIRAIGMDD
jgi:hypothetical protein